MDTQTVNFIERMGLAAILDKYVATTDPRCRVSHAKALGVLLLAAVGNLLTAIPAALCGFNDRGLVLPPVAHAAQWGPASDPEPPASSTSHGSTTDDSPPPSESISCAIRKRRPSAVVRSTLPIPQAS